MRDFKKSVQQFCFNLMENALCWSRHFIYIDEQWLIAEVAQQCNEFLSKAFPQEKKLELLQIAFLVSP